jgi:glucose/arabinose dehydrogenase
MKRVWILLIILVVAGCKPGSSTPGLQASPAAFQLETIAPASAFSTPTEPVLPEPTYAATLTAEVQPQDETPPPSPEAEPGIVSALPDPSLYQWEKVLGGFRLPVFLTGAGDGSGRLFIVTQPGVISVIRDGVILDTPFLDIQEQVSKPDQSGYYGERGLLGLAFHPRFHENGYFYVNYTDRDGNTVIARYTAIPTADQADPLSEVRLLLVEQPYVNHNGGMLAFGPDGYLYIGLGDGGSAGDPLGNGQSLETWLGKILRIDVDRGEPYAVPADNPFASQGGKPEIWAYGLRNPWRFSFDSLSGDLYIGDVGQAEWEEVDFLAAGSPGGVNFGWDYREGGHAYEGEPSGSLSLNDPVAEYSHDLGCSITGGVVYRGMNLPEWQGVYLYGDYCNGNIWGLLRSPDGTWQNQLLFATGISISSFGVDEAGEIYLLDLRLGELYRLTEK